MAWHVLPTVVAYSPATRLAALLRRGAGSVVVVSAVRCPCEAESRGHSHQVSQRAGLHFSHHLPTVSLHGDLADAELATDLLIQQAGDDQRHDFPFAAAERRVTIPQRPYLRLVSKCSLAALDGVPDGAQQHVVPEWLRQELDSSCLHGLDRRRHVAVARDEDNRHVKPIDSDALLQIETIEVRKSNVKYQATRNKDSWASEEFFCGRECLRLPACEANQRFQRFAHRDVVVDNEHYWCRVRHRR